MCMYCFFGCRSCVAFDGKKRIIGVAAKNQQVTNMKNTVNGFKRLLGRKFNDPHVQRELSSIPTKVESLPDGSIGFRVNYLDQEQCFTPEQLTAMLFTKLKETSSNALGAQVCECSLTKYLTEITICFFRSTIALLLVQCISQMLNVKLFLMPPKLLALTYCV